MNNITLTNHFSKKKNLIMLSILFTIWSVFNAKAQTFPAGFTQQLVESGFTKPTTFAFAPDGRIFVCEQTGRVRVVKNGNLLARPFVNVRVNSAGERGLLGIAFDPDFINNNYVYLYYTLFSKVNNRISRFTAYGDTVVPGSEVVVLDLDSINNVNHNAGFMQFGPDGKLWVCVGENRVAANAQNLDKHHGKILRINTDGSPAAGNPFPTGSLARQRTWAYGVRNPYTIAFQPSSGKIFMNDVGTTKFEEVNDMTIGGQNFGWPGAEGNSMNPLYTNPIYAYPHGFAGLGEGCAITGGTFFNPVATNYPGTYTGNYFFIDYCGNWIDMLTFSGSTFTRSNFASDIAGFPVGLTVGTDGNFYFISRNNSALYKIVYGPTPVTTRLTPIADAYVRGASTTANTNYGRAATLLTQANANVGLTYETFLKFDITSFSGPVSSAKLRVYGGLSASTIPSLNVEAHHVSNTSWLDTTITWNNKPAADAAVLATATIHGTSKEYYDWDITAHIIALKTAGATAMTIKLNNTTATAIRAIFNSKEASTFRPQLVIVHAGPPTIMNTARSASTIVQDFDIYPNPAGDFFNISLKNIEGDARLAIYDVKGQLVMKRIIENNSLERINTEMLENGVYLVMISNGNGVMTKKVLLNKGSE